MYSEEVDLVELVLLFEMVGDEVDANDGLHHNRWQSALSRPSSSSSR